MEQRHLHEVVRPLKELAHQFGEFVLDKVVPKESVEGLAQTIPFEEQ